MPRVTASVAGTRLGEFAASQDGVPSRQQLRALDITRNHIRSRVASGVGS